MLGDVVDLPRIHDLRDDRHPGRSPNVRQHLERAGAESLEGVG